MPWAGGLQGPELATRTAVAGAISNDAPWTCQRPTKGFAAVGLGAADVLVGVEEVLAEVLVGVADPAELLDGDVVVVDGWEPHAASAIATASTTRPGHCFTVGTLPGLGSPARAFTLR
jgi:hypothetical protein